MINSLKSLQLTIGDNRLDDRSVAEEIKKTMEKVRPDETQQASEEDLAINNAKTVAYNACARALESLNMQ